MSEVIIAIENPFNRCQMVGYHGPDQHLPQLVTLILMDEETFAIRRVNSHFDHKVVTYIVADPKDFPEEETK